MYQKEYERKFTDSRFQDCQFFLDTQDSFIITTMNREMDLNQLSCQYQQQQRYTSFLVGQNSTTKLQDFRILDVGQHMELNEELNHQSEKFYKIWLSGNFEATNEKFAAKYRKHFGNSIVNLVNDSPFLAKLMNSQVVLKINRQKNKLFLQDYQWNVVNFDIFGILPKRKTNYVIKKSQRTVLDLQTMSQKNQRLQNVEILNQHQAFLHIGSHSQMVSKNFMICKYDLTEEAVMWKQQLTHFKTFHDKSIQISQNSILNGVYDFQDNSSALQLYDFRTKGAISLVLHSTSREFDRFGGNLLPNLHYLQKVSDFQMLSIVSSRGGAVSQPFLFDLRNSQPIEMLKPKKEDEKISFLKEMQFKQPYLYTVERQYQGYIFKNAKICKYRLQK